MSMLLICTSLYRVDKLDWLWLASWQLVVVCINLVVDGHFSGLVVGDRLASLFDLRVGIRLVDHRVRLLIICAFELDLRVWENYCFFSCWHFSICFLWFTSELKWWGWSSCWLWWWLSRFLCDILCPDLNEVWFGCLSYGAAWKDLLIQKLGFCNSHVKDSPRTSRLDES